MKNTFLDIIHNPSLLSACLTFDDIKYEKSNFPDGIVVQYVDFFKNDFFDQSKTFTVAQKIIIIDYILSLPEIRILPMQHCDYQLFCERAIYHNKQLHLFAMGAFDTLNLSLKDIDTYFQAIGVTFIKQKDISKLHKKLFIGVDERITLAQNVPFNAAFWEKLFDHFKLFNKLTYKDSSENILMKTENISKIVDLIGKGHLSFNTNIMSVFEKLFKAWPNDNILDSCSKLNDRTRLFLSYYLLEKNHYHALSYIARLLPEGAATLDLDRLIAIKDNSTMLYEMIECHMNTFYLGIPYTRDAYAKLQTDLGLTAMSDHEFVFGRHHAVIEEFNLH